MRIPPNFCAALVALSVFATGCSSIFGQDASESVSTSTTTPTTTTSPATAPPSTQFEVVTTIRRIPAPELASTGHITIESVRYEFAFECYAAGAGDILALGVGDAPETGDPTQAIVQAFLGQTYVAILIGDAQVLELAIDRPARLFVQGEMIRGSALRFVDSVGSAGVGEEIGLGTVSVSCQGYAPGLPDDYIIS